MLTEILSVQYFELKEKALLQRHYIDYTMAEHEKKIKEDSSNAGKAHLEAYQKEIGQAEDDFIETITALQPVFDELYQRLEELNATKEHPYQMTNDTISLELYIDDHKNIHYRKID